LKLLPAIAVILLLTFANASPVQTVVKTTWTPPPSRKAKTPFAPKPIIGDNIFKGDAEIWLADAVERLEGGVFSAIPDQSVTDYVTKVGQNIALYSVAPTKQYRFIVTTDWVADAMTAGGGRIYINRGMLAQIESEDELAGVLAHEIAHDAFHHASKTVTRQMFWLTGTRTVNTSAEVKAALAKLLNEYENKPLATITEVVLGFSRFDELEADRAAFYNTYKAGYNPYSLATVLKRMSRAEEEEIGASEYRMQELLTILFGSHPPTAQRSFALSWESNFVKMPAKDSRFVSPAFDEMKQRIAAMSK